MQNLQVGLGAVLALDTSAFLARQPPPRQPETTRHDGITPSNTPPSIRHPTHRLLWDAPENRASGPPSTAWDRQAACPSFLTLPTGGIGFFPAARIVPMGGSRCGPYAKACLSQARRRCWRAAAQPHRAIH